jgi:hypothetical protein
MPVSSLLMGSLMGGGSGGGSGAGVANIAGGLLSGVTGFFQRRKAKKELAKLHRPEYTIPEEITRSQKMAEMSANEGLPSAQYNKAMQNIQRTQANMLAGANDRRSGLMALPKIQQAANDATLGLDVADAQARLQNQKTLYSVSGQTAQYKDKAFQTNKMQPYQQNLNYYQSLLGAGNQNMLGGADKILGGTASLLFGGGSGSGQTRGMRSGRSSGAPTYYNDYNSGSSYGDFENGY